MQSSTKFDHSDARRNYDRISRWYDALEGGWEDGLRKKALDSLQLPEDARILEIGCGTGASLIDLSAKSGLRGLVYGTDLSKGMLQNAGARLKNLDRARLIRLIQSDALCLPFSPGVFDSVYMSFTLELFPEDEIILLLKECSRVLKPAGLFNNISISWQGGSQRVTALYDRIHRLFPKVVDCRPICATALLEKAGYHILLRKTSEIAGIGVEIVTASS